MERFYGPAFVVLFVLGTVLIFFASQGGDKW